MSGDYINPQKLRAAAEWCRAYEGDATVDLFLRDLLDAAEWLDHEADRRENAKWAKKLGKKHGVTAGTAAQVLRQVREQLPDLDPYATADAVLKKMRDSG